MATESLITDDMRKSVGTQVFPDFPPEEVCMWTIRRYLEAISDTNPLWTDAEYASHTRWGGLVAPPGVIEVFNPANHAFRRYDDMSHMSLPFNPPFTKTFMAFNEYQFFLPVRPGDVLTSVCKIGDVYERQSTSGSGRMVFIRLDNEHRNQRGELVGIASEAMVSMEGSSGRKPAELSPPPADVRPAQAGRSQLHFEDVEVGTELPAFTKEYSLYTILKWGAATNDYGPHHFDYKFATEMLGMPNVIAHGPHNTAFLIRLVTDWVGGNGAIRKHYAEMRGNVFPGDTMTFQGRVANKYVQDGEGLVEIESTATNQNGKKVTLARSVAVLPLRG